MTRRLVRLAFVVMVILGEPLTASGADSAAWMILSREEGCVPLDVVARGDRLPRAPVSPDDYAAMMRARGHQPTIGPPPGFPADLAGAAVMVGVRPDHAPIFVRADVCRRMKEP